MKSLLLGFAAGVCCGFAIAIFVADDTVDNIISKTSYVSNLSISKQAQTIDVFPSTVLKTFNLPQTQPPIDFKVEFVSSTKELVNAIINANMNGGRTAIYLNDGDYALNKTLVIKSDDIMLLSVSANPYKTTIKGLGMKRTPKVDNIIKVRASGFVLDGIRLADAPNHLIQISAEDNANRPTLRNCILQDSYEQLVKVSYDQNKRPQNISNDGIVEHCIFQYTQGMAPFYYTGGIDALGAKRWRVENNIFKDIASPGKHIAQHAVHFWINASDNTVINNIFIDNDRSIGFGMRQKRRDNPNLEYFSKGGLIESNVIYHSNNGDPYADTGIILEASPETVVRGNYILMQHFYPRAIEYRYQETRNALIENNYTNKAIYSRNGGEALLLNNEENVDPLFFFSKFESAMKAQGVISLFHPLNAATHYD